MMKRAKRKPAKALYNVSMATEPGDRQLERKQEFGRRLQAIMVELGWNQSELARRAGEHLPEPRKGQKQRHGFPRDLISHYVRGVRLPRPEGLGALCKALSAGARRAIAPADIMPPPGWTPRTANGAVSMRVVEPGRVAMQFSRVLSMKTATRIVEMLKAEDRA